MNGRTGARRRRVAIAALVGLLAAGCSSGNDGGGDQVSQDDGGSAGAAVQELVVGYGEDPWIDAAETDKKRFPGYPLQADVCETLVKLTPDFQVAPSLANDWELVGDKTFRFTLEGEPTFSDGTPLTADAVEYTMDYTAQEPPVGGDGIGPDSTRVIDERTVEVTPTEPNLRLVQQMTHPTFHVLAPGSDPLTDTEGVTCTGPFEVAEYVPDERLVVERNDDYWGEPAKLDKITFRFIPDDTTRTLALQNGEVDLITDVPRGVLSSIRGLPGVKVAKAPVGQILMAYVARRDLAGTDKPLADPQVRRAVAHAIDRAGYIEGVLDGHGVEVTTVAPPAVLGEHADLVRGVPYDPDEAARLLDEAGWKVGPDGRRFKDGRPLELSMVFARVDLTTMEYVQAALAEVGIKGNIEQLDAGAYRDRLDTGNYDLDFSGSNQNDAKPAFLLSLRWWSKADGENAQFIAPGPDTEFERIIDQTQRATDNEELQRLAAEAMHELVDNEVAGIPLAGAYRIYAMKDDVEGFEAHPSSTNQRWSTVFISE